LTRPASFRPEDVWRGGYAVRDPGAATQVVLVATGSEVSLACDAAEKLAAERVPARVVSLPSLELFLAQPAAYRRALVPETGPPVVVVEAGRGESLRRLAGTRGLVYGIDRFGSALTPIWPSSSASLRSVARVRAACASSGGRVVVETP
jgi:transketolase